MLAAMGCLVAWSHMRNSGWKGSAILDEWIEFGHSRGWRIPFLDYAKACANQVKQDWLEFSEAYQLWAAGAGHIPAQMI